MALHTVTRLLVNRQEISETQLDTYTLDDAALADNEILLRITDFGLSANNITYAALGHKMGYWGFFPGTREKGIIPVWGFADVVVSRHPDLPEGERVYGYLPFATHLVIQPDAITQYTFTDSHPQRESIHPVYDQYTRCKTDPAYQADNEVWQMNFRPLFMTSFVLDQAVSAFASHTIVITSASSKTALGAAFLLANNRHLRQAKYRIVGLTSDANMPLTQDFGCYDEVFSYNDIASFTTSGPAIVLDFAGNGELLSALAKQCEAALEKIWMIGATDWDATAGQRPKDVEATLFFAPEHVAQLQQRWGGKAFMQHYAQAWNAFYQHVSEHFSVNKVSGQSAIQQAYLQLLEGECSPSKVNGLQWYEA